MSQLLTLNQVTQRHPAFTLDAIRGLIFRQHENGLAGAGAIVRVGRRVLIDAHAFDRWLEARRQAA